MLLRLLLRDRVQGWSLPGSLCISIHVGLALRFTLLTTARDRASISMEC